MHMTTLHLDINIVTYQAGGFEIINGEQRYVRYVEAQKGEIVQQAKLVYDYLGPLESWWVPLASCLPMFITVKEMADWYGEMILGLYVMSCPPLFSSVSTRFGRSRLHSRRAETPDLQLNIWPIRTHEVASSHIS